MSAHLAPDDAFLALHGITKRFGAHVAVDELSLAVRRGEFISLLGPSGGGKTTTLHLIAGFIDADAGDIRIDGQSVRHLPGERRGAAMVFQNYALFPHMTVAENVGFGLRMRKLPRREIAQRVGEALDLVQLDGLAQRYPRQLSGGQQQRVALARAVVVQPRLLLLDEPLSNLDPRLRRELRRDFVDIHRRTGMTTVLVTHDLEEAFATSDRVAVLGEGRLQQFDTPWAIYNRPQTAFVARFVGHRNEVTGRVVRRGTEPWLAVAGTQAVIALPASATGAQVRYAIPAPVLRLQPTNGEGAPARLVSLDYLGAQVRYEVDLDGLRLVGENAAGAWAATLAPGAPVRVHWAPEDMVPLPLPEAG